MTKNIENERNLTQARALEFSIIQEVTDKKLEFKSISKEKTTNYNITKNIFNVEKAFISEVETVKIFTPKDIVLDEETQDIVKFINGGDSLDLKKNEEILLKLNVNKSAIIEIKKIINGKKEISIIYK